MVKRPVVFIFAALALCGCRTAPGGPYRTFAPEGKEFTCEIPADWTISESFRGSSVLSIRSPDEVELQPAHIDIAHMKESDFGDADMSKFSFEEPKEEPKMVLPAATRSTFSETAAKYKERLEWFKKEARGESEISVELPEAINTGGFAGFRYSITSVNFAVPIHGGRKKPDGTSPRAVQEKRTAIYLNTPGGRYDFEYRAPVAVYGMKNPHEMDHTRKTPSDIYEKHLPEFEHLLKTFRWTKKSKKTK